MSLSLQTRGKKHSHIPNLSNREINTWQANMEIMLKAPRIMTKAPRIMLEPQRILNGERTAYNLVQNPLSAHIRLLLRSLASGSLAPQQ